MTTALRRRALTRPSPIARGLISYAHDTLNRLSTLKDFSNGSSGFSYDALGRRTNLTRPNGLSTAYPYDTLSRLLQALHQKGSTLVEGAAYVYDAAGNRTSKTETTPGKHGNTVKADTFSYDAIYELTQAATNGSTTDNDTYDAVGNRLTDVFGGTYSYNNSNELTAYPAYTWTYDNNGNTTGKTVSGSTTTYNWDFENRLTSVVLPGTGGTVSFKYDPFGRRIEKVSPTSGTTIYAYDGDNMVEQLNSSGTATARYTQGPGIDEPLEVYEGGKSYYYHADGLGSIVALTKSTGTAANTYFGYNTFGGMPNPSETVSNPFRFTGRDYDSETGLYYYRARYYDSLFGRFLSEDPIRWAGGLNLYRYVKNQPEVLTDPTGLATNKSSELTCLQCTVYAEARGLDSPCQYAVASVILNRVAEARAKGQRSSVCQVVSSKSNPFYGYGDRNYRNCARCKVPKKDQADLDDTIDNFKQPFDMLSDALYFGNDTPAMQKYFVKKLKKMPIEFPPCPDLIFYGD